MVVDPPISEQMIEAKEEIVKNYRAKLGLAKWCQLYAVEVSEANTIGSFCWASADKQCAIET